MRIVIAPDSFKGSLEASQVANIMGQAITDVDGDASVVHKPMADGGEGSLKALYHTADEAIYQSITVTGPIGKDITVSYIIKNGHTAVIESAQIVGPANVPSYWKHPDHTTSRGIGEAIMNALDSGCTRFLIGLGGSATNDGGLGMLRALGMEAYDADGRELYGFGKDLLYIDRIALQKLGARLKNITFHVAGDVDNPLLGKKGASRIFGKQKGLSESGRKQYDLQMASFAQILERATESAHRNTPGAGAAGGLGFAFLILGAYMESGAKLVAREIQLEEVLQHADAVLTGEGKSDAQTLSGKAPGYVGMLAKKHGVDSLLISGVLERDNESLVKHFTYCSSLSTSSMTQHESMASVKRLLYERTKEVFERYRLERHP